MTQPSIYRARDTEPGKRLRVFPGIATGLVAVMVVISAAPLLLHLLLWSRVVQVHCDRQARGVVVCDVDEGSLGFARSRSTVVLDGPERALVRGAVQQARGDVWVEVKTRTSTVALTRGFNLARIEQAVLAARLTSFFLADTPQAFDGSFGSHWSVAPVPLLGVVAALLLYLLLGQRMTLVRRDDLRTLTIELRRWPLPGKHLGFDLQDVQGFAIGGDPRSRIWIHRHGTNVVLRLNAGGSVRLSYCAPPRAAQVVDRLNGFLADGRPEAREAHSA